LRTTRLIHPEYVENFKCIGPDCEDTCCVGWSVDIDQATYEKYKALPASPLRVLIDTAIQRVPAPADGSAPRTFAQVHMASGMRCPLHNADQLCQIQVELGPSYLSQTCLHFPRSQSTIDGFKDQSLTLSCPEAARLVLLNPNLLSGPQPGETTMTWDDQVETGSHLRGFFWPIREFTVNLLRNRTYPLWQRMFLLGTFSRRMEAVVQGELPKGFPALLKDFSRAIAKGSLRASIETIQPDLPLQLQMVLELVKLRAGKVYVNPRLGEIMRAFVLGVGHGVEQPPLDLQAAHYAEAYRLYYAPFFDKHPHILENFLIHMVIRKLFPFGNLLFQHEATPTPAKDFAMLATEFSLIKGLLIGVAGGYKHEFTTERVIQTVQTAFKHFEHNADFLVKAHQLLVDKKMDNAQGLTMLLRN
jgi:lysine-N-methylase